MLATDNLKQTFTFTPIHQMSPPSPMVDFTGTKLQEQSEEKSAMSKHLSSMPQNSPYPTPPTRLYENFDNRSDQAKMDKEAHGAVNAAMTLATLFDNDKMATPEMSRKRSINSLYGDSVPQVPSTPKTDDGKRDFTLFADSVSIQDRPSSTPASVYSRRQSDAESLRSDTVLTSPPTPRKLSYVDQALSTVDQDLTAKLTRPSFARAKPVKTIGMLYQADRHALLKRNLAEYMSMRKWGLKIVPGGGLPERATAPKAGQKKKVVRQPRAIRKTSGITPAISTISTPPRTRKNTQDMARQKSNASVMSIQSLTNTPIESTKRKIAPEVTTEPVVVKKLKITHLKAAAGNKPAAAAKPTKVSKPKSTKAKSKDTAKTFGIIEIHGSAIRSALDRRITNADGDRPAPKAAPQYFEDAWIPPMNMDDKTVTRSNAHNVKEKKKADTNDACFGLLHPVEVQLAEELRLTPTEYITQKRRYFLGLAEWYRIGHQICKVSHAQKFCNMDGNTSSLLHRTFEDWRWPERSNFADEFLKTLAPLTTCQMT